MISDQGPKSLGRAASEEGRATSASDRSLLPLPDADAAEVGRTTVHGSQ